MGTTQVKRLGWDLEQLLLLLRGALLPCLKQAHCRRNFDANIMPGEIQPFWLLQGEEVPVTGPGFSNPLPKFRVLR